MAKKISDIRSSRALQEKGDGNIKIVAAKSAKTVELEQIKKDRRIPFLIGFSIAVALALGYFFIPHKAKIDIWPVKKSIEQTLTVTVGQTKRGENFIQGKVLEIEKAVSQSFTAQGTKLKSAKAHGIIRIYNNYLTIPQVLVAKTRFVSDDGKLFRISEKITVPGGHYEGGKLTAGFIDVEVFADQPGADYNINPSTFSIPGFVGTPKYTAFYAKSFEPMSGGENKEVSYIAEKDLEEAREILAKLAPAESETAINGLISSENYILVEGAISNKISGFEPSVLAGQEANNFSAQMKATAQALVFKEQDLIDFSKSYIAKKLAPGEKLIEISVKIEYAPSSVNLAAGEIALRLSISAKSHSLPEEIKIKEMVKNRNIKEVEGIIGGFSQIEKAKVEFWPFWVELAPQRSESIKITLHLD